MRSREETVNWFVSCRLKFTPICYLFYRKVCILGFVCLIMSLLLLISIVEEEPLRTKCSKDEPDKVGVGG